MAVYHGENVSLDYGDLELTEELQEALIILDDSCRGGSGGTYEIYDTQEERALWEAVPVDGPYDVLYFIDGDWTETPCEEEEDEEYDGEDDDWIVEGRPEGGE